MNDTKVIKKMNIREDTRAALTKKITELSIELEKSPLTISNWIYNRPHMFKKKYIQQAVKKITGVKKDQIFEPEENEPTE